MILDHQGRSASLNLRLAKVLSVGPLQCRPNLLYTLLSMPSVSPPNFFTGLCTRGYRAKAGMGFR